MKRIQNIFPVILLIGCSIYFIRCSESEYVRSFDWMVETFEENDAGFPFYISEKGIADYSVHTTEYRKKIRRAKSESEAVAIMNGWLRYFRKWHIGVFPNTGSGLPGDHDCVWSKEEFNDYFKKNKDSLHQIEGVWSNGQYDHIGIVRTANDKFCGFTVGLEDDQWIPMQKILGLELSDDSVVEVDFSIKNYADNGMPVKWIGDSGGLISMAGMYLKKDYPKVSYSDKDAFFIATMLVNRPILKELSDNTIYLRIPSFEMRRKEGIDRLLSQNDALIRSTPNLIIDIRNGTGGGDASHYGLIPYYYTQPIRLTGVRYRATEANAVEYENYSQIFKDTATILSCQYIAQNMRENMGGYFDHEPIPTVLGELSEYPSRVAVICNGNNASADEQFLYMARQSYKTKIFGEPTMGALDLSNVSMIDFPNGKYSLALTMTVSCRYPDYKIDNIGIQPDFFIDDTINEIDWVEFVQSVIEAEK